MPRCLYRADHSQKLGARVTGTANRAAFDPRVMIAVILVGVIGFIAMWALIALGPQLSADNNGRGHAMARSVQGFAGIVDLAERSDMWVEVRRKVVEAQPLADDEGRTLLVLTPDFDSDPQDLAGLIEAHGDEPVLLVLPKWKTGPHKTQKGWSGSGSAIPAPANLLPQGFADDGDRPRLEDIARPAPVVLAGTGFDRGPVTLRAGEWQLIAIGRNTPMLALPGSDDAVLLRAARGDLYVLTDPDLINNFAFASRGGARTALAVMDAVAEDSNAGGIAFDVTLNGLGSGGSGFLRLAFVPPFIGITLCLIAAGILALWQAAVRFGPARVMGRVIPISKLALIESSAELVAQTQRESDAVVPWLRGQREAVARALHAPPGLAGEALDQWIDRRRAKKDGANGFAALARRLLLARSTTDMLGTARELHRIRKEILREH